MALWDSINPPGQVDIVRLLKPDSGDYFLVLLCIVEELRSLPFHIWCTRLKKRFANKIFGVDDAHCGWDRELLVESLLQHSRFIF
jgi:hypothetical protein